MHHPLTLSSWPRVIVHLQADAFCTSVEQIVHPELKGKPIVTGAERGVVAAASREAADCGIQRGLSLTEAAHLCPDLIMLPSDPATYRHFSDRMFAILQRFATDVEPHAIDGAFADLGGARRTAGLSIPEMAKQIQQTIQHELGISVSIGVSLSKSLAQLCSHFRTPHGITVAPGHAIHLLLERTAVTNLCGVSAGAIALLEHHGCRTALDFARKPRYFAEELLGAIGVEIWSELRGEYVYRLATTRKIPCADRAHSPARAAHRPANAMQSIGSLITLH